MALPQTPQYNTQELIDSIKRRCTTPTSQLTLEPEDFCAFANDDMLDIIVPTIMSAREEYFLSFEELTTTADGVLIIPEKAMGEKLRSVFYRQNSSPLNLQNIPRLDLDVIGGIGPINYNYYVGFYVQDNKLMLYPNTSVPAGTAIRLYYYNRVLQLAVPNSYGQISSIDTIGMSFVLDSVPLSWEAGTRLNAVSSTPSFKTTNELMTVLSVSSPTVFVDNVDGLSVGDYVSIEGFSAIPQIPLEAHAVLAQITAGSVLAAVGDLAGAEKAENKAKVLMEKMMVFVSQRVDGSVKKVINPNGGLRYGSGLGGSKGWGYGRGWW